MGKYAQPTSLKGTVEEKHFITSTVISNINYYDQKLDIELFPVFYTLFDLIKDYNTQNDTLELSESTDFTNKKDPQKGQYK